MDFFHWCNIEKSALSYDSFIHSFKLHNNGNLLSSDSLSPFKPVSQPFFVQKLFSFAVSFSCLFICLLRWPPSSYICSHWLHLFRKFYLNRLPTDNFFVLLFHFRVCSYDSSGDLLLHIFAHTGFICLESFT